MEFTMRLDIPKESWLNSNQRMHHFETARRTKSLRTRTFWKARRKLQEERAVAPIWNEERPCIVECAVSIPTRHRYDPPNAYPALKAVLDGFTDAGVWSDDRAEVVREVTFKAGKPTGIRDMYRLYVTVRSIHD